MHGVVAVLHEHSIEFTELHGEGYGSCRTQTIDVFAAALPRGHIRRAAIAGKNLAFFKVDVNRMVPTTAGIDERPDLARSGLRCCGNSAIVGGKHGSQISFNTPGILVSRIIGIYSAATELKSPLTHHRNLRKIRVGDHLCRNLALVRLGRVLGDAEL